MCHVIVIVSSFGVFLLLLFPPNINPHRRRHRRRRRRRFLLFLLVLGLNYSSSLFVSADMNHTHTQHTRKSLLFFLESIRRNFFLCVCVDLKHTQRDTRNLHHRQSQDKLNFEIKAHIVEQLEA